MPIEITMPRLSDTMEEGTLNKWLVSVGDTVESGDTLAEVETDKATMELQAYDDGTIAALAVDEGETTAVGSLIAVLAEEGEDPEEAAKAAEGGGSGGSDEDEEDDTGDEEESAGEDSGEEEDASSDKGSDKSKDEEAEKDTADDADRQAAAAGGGKRPQPRAEGDRIRVSPVAARMAEENGLELSRIEGSGPHGRIIKRDVQRAIKQGTASSSGGVSDGSSGRSSAPESAVDLGPGTLSDESVDVSQMRKTIAR
ncbi:MAG: biotin/lipoyl-containing protein, partial [Phycisphaeraceae bacterium]|nr:biotin/lipoyl-containing protein [Phycisphaeraceae bacterium]